MRKLALFVLAAVVLGSVCAVAADNGTPQYAVDKSYKVQLPSVVLYMATDPQSNIWALLQDGTVVGIAPSGKQIKSFTPKLEGQPESIAIDQQGNLTVLSSRLKLVDFKYNGKRFKRAIPVQATYLILDQNGKELKRGELKGIMTASAARYSKNILVVADNIQSSLIFYDLDADKIINKTSKGIRLCCGIFDFWVDPDGSILVASLAAFKVLSFEPSGEGGDELFGKRGPDLDDFHGCCNPVSVARLPDKSIVTVEKDTTRIKIYDPQGKHAKLIEGVMELVKGCLHIPLAVDSAGNIYLASDKGAIIKCSKKKAEK